MNSQSDIKNWRKKDFFKSAGFFFLFYLLSVLFIFLMIVMTQWQGIGRFLTENYSKLIYLFLCLFLLFSLTYCYYYFENRSVLKDPKQVSLIFTILIVCELVNFVFGKYINIYAKPIAMFTLLCLLLLKRNDAMFLSVIFPLYMAVVDFFLLFGTENISIVFTSLLACYLCEMIAFFLISNEASRFKTMINGLIIFLPIGIVIILIQLIEPSNIIKSLGFGLLGAVGSVVLYTVFLPVFESVFNVVTDYRLKELCDHGYKLMRDLKNKAVGTFNHSMIVAHLAEACAVELDENPTLARAAAYYHDVGKIRQSEFFTENQTGFNAHDELSPELSVDIVRSHAKDGRDLIKAHYLPEILADIAIQHHGTMPIKYFYAKALKLTDGEVNIDDFSYAGPKPQTKMAAIIMICDAAEASTRALPDRKIEKVERVVRDVIEERIDLEQFDECAVTLKDLNIIKSTIVRSLTGINHSRVNYPKIRIAVQEEIPVENEEEIEEDVKTDNP